MLIVLPLEKISSNSTVGGLDPDFQPQNFCSVLLLAWGEGWWLARLCFLAAGNTKVTGSNLLVLELEAILGHSKATVRGTCLLSVWLFPVQKGHPAPGNGHCTIFHFSQLENVTVDCS